tara:strand:+ start:348 stop:905 length:558 start_codon:yes stop_codon:yes gene_type:complete
MAKLSPTITFTTNSDQATTNPGPGSISLAASISDLLTVDLQEQRLITTSTTQEKILDGYVLGGATKTPGTVGCYIFMKNNDTTTGNNILVGVVSGSHYTTADSDGQTTITGLNNPIAPGPDTEDNDGSPDSTGDASLDVASSQTLRTFTLLPGEFAWFPFDYTGDIYIEAAQNTPALEYWRWDKA